MRTTVVHLVVLGFGQMGQNVALRAAKVGHFANGQKLRISVIDKEIDSTKETFLRRYPSFDKELCDTEFVSGDTEDPKTLERIKDLTKEADELMTVVVCLDDDWQSFLFAQKLKQRLSDFNAPIFFRKSEQETLSSLWEDEEFGSRGRGTTIIPFGMVDVVCTRESLRNKSRDKLARRIHEDFVDQRKKEGRLESDASMKDWEDLGPDFKDSNRQQADHLPVKLRAIGCFSSPEILEAAIVDSFEPGEIELLAQMEHARWTMDRVLNDWTHAPGPKDEEKKTSPYLVNWDALPEDVKDYDREVAKNIPRLVEMVGEAIYRGRERE